MDTTKLQQYFDGMIVHKSSNQSIFSSLNIPSYIRDWFLKRYANQDGGINVDFVMAKIRSLIPSANEFNAILDRMIRGESVKILAKIQIRMDIKTGSFLFELPDFSIDSTKTHIPLEVWDKIKSNLLLVDGAIWGIIELSYAMLPVKKEKVGKIILQSFQSFSPYKVDLAYYKEARSKFDIEEWINLLLMAIDYNPDGFTSLEQKVTMLYRLIPFVENRINLMELAPKGTGKSYLFSQISKYAWLNSGGVMTRAKLFYDMNKKTDGLLSKYDLVALDEISTIKFPDEAEMQGALKGYMENGKYSVGNKLGSSNAGIVILGNIKVEQMDLNQFLFDGLPHVFSDSALIDRFHGFIEGWKIPRMKENLKVNGWALNSEYFSSILHELRSDYNASDLVNYLLEVPNDADTRDVNAVKRIASALLKLFFPHFTKHTYDVELFKVYCLNPAIHMRRIIKDQLCMMDSEYKNNPFPEFGIKEV